jgi:hypothetical protein
VGFYDRVDLGPLPGAPRFVPFETWDSTTVSILGLCRVPGAPPFPRFLREGGDFQTVNLLAPHPRLRAFRNLGFHDRVDLGPLPGAPPFPRFLRKGGDFQTVNLLAPHPTFRAFRNLGFHDRVDLGPLPGAPPFPRFLREGGDFQTVNLLAPYPTFRAFQNLGFHDRPHRSIPSLQATAAASPARQCGGCSIQKKNESPSGDDTPVFSQRS